MTRRDSIVESPKHPNFKHARTRMNAGERAQTSVQGRSSFISTQVTSQERHSIYQQRCRFVLGLTIPRRSASLHKCLIVLALPRGLEPLFSP